MEFDIKDVPFSRHGSFFAFSRLTGKPDRPEGVYLRTVHGNVPCRELFRIELIHNGTPVPFAARAEPSVLRLESEFGSVEACIADAQTVRLRGSGVTLRLTMAGIGDFDNAFPVANGRWRVNRWSSRLCLMVVPRAGGLSVDAPWRTVNCERVVAEIAPDEETGAFECAIEECGPAGKPGDNERDFDDCVKAAAREFRKWRKRTPKVSTIHAEPGELASYVLWSAMVPSTGHFTRPAMLMSKNHMTNVWSWDNCFNAMALTYNTPDLAWDQLMLVVDHQDADGAFPDSINDQVLVWNFCKPPIHGWTLRWMMDRTNFITNKHLKEIYRPLCRWTDWWLDYRDSDSDGVPQYNHGNDSGWDNATAFDIGAPVEGPDLSAFLVIQMDTLSDAADALGRRGEARRWKRRADDLLDKLIEHSWQHDRFVARRSGDHAVADGDSLLAYLPIILGKRLPKHIRTALVAGLQEQERFFTEHGLATENVKSRHYRSDGYWRGPIWAPATLIIVDGLVALGEPGFARKISKRFCDLVARSGMAENFDALTGEGLCDRAYTWTASVFLTLGHEYV